MQLRCLHLLASKIVIYNFLLTTFLRVVEFLDELRDIALDLESLSTLQVLLLVCSKEHCVLLFRAKVQQELMSRLGNLSNLYLHILVGVD